MSGPASINDYSNFNPQEFYNMYYNKLDCPYWPKQHFNNLLDQLSRIYNSGKIEGSTLLDFGTGPTIYNLVSAVRHFPNIYLSDFSENNRNVLWRWLNKDPDSYDFSHFLQYQIEKEQLGCSCRELEDDMRSRVRGILSCDMTLDNPLYPSMFPQFDVISTSLCLSVEPSRTQSGYEDAVKNVSSLLKPGGWVVYIDTLGCSYYDVGFSRYETTPLNKESVVKSFTNAGFHVDTWSQFESEVVDCIRKDDAERVFCMTCTKGPN